MCYEINENRKNREEIMTNFSVWTTQIAKFMWPTWSTPGSCRPHVGSMNLAIRVWLLTWQSQDLSPDGHLVCVRHSKLKFYGLTWPHNWPKRRKIRRSKWFIQSNWLYNLKGLPLALCVPMINHNCNGLEYNYQLYKRDQMPSYKQILDYHYDYIHITYLAFWRTGILP